MANPCMHYGIPCEAGTEGNCVCRKRFFAAPSPELRQAAEEALKRKAPPDEEWIPKLAAELSKLTD